MTLNDIIQSFKINEDNIKKAIKVDNTDFKFNINKAIDILNRFREFETGFLNKKSLVVTNGNPYITIILCMQAISQNISLCINVQDTMVELNKAIVDIFETYLNQMGIKVVNYMTVEEFKNTEADDIVVIDDKSKFNFLKDELRIKVRYVSLLSIDLYTDLDDDSSLTNTINDYCSQRFIGLDIHKNETLDDFVEETNKY